MKLTSQLKHFLHFASLALVLLLFLIGAPALFAQSTDSGIQNVPPQSTAFTDVPQNHTRYTPILYLKEAGIFGGYDDGSFKPDNSIKKAESLKVIFESAVVDSSKPYQAGLFPDVRGDQWFAPYVQVAFDKGFVSGNGDDGTFAGGEPVTMAVFLKMTLEAHGIDVSAFEGKEVVPGVSPDKWYTGYINYGASFGIIPKEADGSVNPSKVLSRADVAESLYLLRVIMNGGDSQFLLTQSELNLAQIEVYIANKDIISAKKSSELAVDMTQQAYKNDSSNAVILGAAKIARAYDLLVDTYILAVQGKNDEALAKAEETKIKATEAWEANKDTQPIAAHIKKRADEIVDQL